MRLQTLSCCGQAKNICIMSCTHLMTRRAELARGVNVWTDTAIDLGRWQVGRCAPRPAAPGAAERQTASPADSASPRGKASEQPRQVTTFDADVTAQC